MNDLQTKKRLGVRAVRHRIGKVQLPVALGMTVVWMLLFNAFQLRPESLGIMVVGFLVSVTIMMVFPLPPIVPGFRFWPLQGVRMFLYIVAKMGVASFQVTLQVFRPGPPVRSSVVAVRLRTDSDLMLVCTSIATSIIPGSVIVEVAQPEHVLYVHVLGAEDEDAVSTAKKDIHDLEERIVRALGTRENIAELEAALATERGNE
ncbi:Na+/H+ antiporter subunit E [Nocardiopsis sp. MG754419]|uniref:Na+/H+ antiporter subunit E n=1 Tax=Nocardiopsis sp. MG754419 TaxID=2259865 RepID=UPI001BA89822|nr:Na+/H+ antiporter subunit E [Nocardiopsis sp. MG754419]MBR8743662.1 Na+/H+ antiporter subunit E [Nocardiopsis sp. MG754419]